MTAVQIVTLVIATLGLVVATASFVWNLALYRLQGPRAKVEAVVGAEMVTGMFRRARGTWVSPSSLARIRHAR